MHVKPTIFLLGTNHFDNPDNGDMFKTDNSDILSGKRQKEMQELVQALNKFKPTKIALEVLTERKDSLNRDYRSFLDGELSLTANERHQIGFRLGREQNLSELHAVDWNQPVEGIPDLDAWAKKNDSTLYFETVEAIGKVMEEHQQYYKSHSILEYIRYLNAPENVKLNHQFYMKLALVGTETEPVGTMWTSQYWYYRNMIIYKNLVQLTESSSDRILVIYGAGHLYILQQFLLESGMFKLVTADEHLGRGEMG